MFYEIVAISRALALPPPLPLSSPVMRILAKARSAAASRQRNDSEIVPMPCAILAERNRFVREIINQPAHAGAPSSPR